MIKRAIIFLIRNIVLAFMKVFYGATYKNKKNSRLKGPIILYINHKSMLDILLLAGVYVPFIRWMAKDSLFKNPVFGAVLKWAGAFPVKRGKHATDSFKTAQKVLQEGGVLSIFPEGTRNRTGKNTMTASRTPILLASKYDVPILPIAIKGDYKLFRRTTMIFGEPIRLQKPDDGELTSDEMQQISDRIMAGIYELIES